MHFRLRIKKFPYRIYSTDDNAANRDDEEIDDVDDDALKFQGENDKIANVNKSKAIVSSHFQSACN